MNTGFNSNINLLMGGTFHGGNDWNKPSNDIDKCYKLYYIKKGEAVLNTESESYTLTKSNLYFINGYRIKAQKCIQQLEIDWIHFLPESVYLNHVIRQANCVIPLPLENYFLLQDICKSFESFFLNKLDKTNEQIILLKMLSVLHLVIADVFNALERNIFDDNEEASRLLPALDLITKDFNKPIKLEQVAQQCCLSPNYFHRLFSRTFNTSPLIYIRKIRMEESIRQLVYTSKSVKEIAYAVGYDDEAYFSRIFTKHYKISPGRYRARFGRKLP